jgi:hypothetical protein
MRGTSREPSSIRARLVEVARHGGVTIERVVEEHAERSAIREYLGGMSREEAEAAAVGDAADALGIGLP